MKVTKVAARRVKSKRDAKSVKQENTFFFKLCSFYSRGVLFRRGICVLLAQLKFASALAKPLACLVREPCVKCGGANRQKVSVLKKYF